MNMIKKQYFNFLVQYHIIHRQRSNEEKHKN